MTLLLRFPFQKIRNHLQAGVLARDMQKVDQYVIYQCIGREAGWLVGATAAGKKDPENAPPHFIARAQSSF